MSAPVIAGNVYDKWATRNPIAKLLMDNFERTMADVVLPLDVASILEVGCGEGEVSSRLAALKPGARTFASDLDVPIVRLAQQRHGHVPFFASSATALPFGDGAADLVVLSEVLEHLPDPAGALAEASRVAHKYCLLSVPREPIWRALNMFRGAYVSDLGNTPGHIQHWSTSAFVAFVSQRLDVLAVRTPFPWTMVLGRPRR